MVVLGSIQVLWGIALRCLDWIARYDLGREIATHWTMPAVLSFLLSVEGQLLVFLAGAVLIFLAFRLHVRSHSSREQPQRQQQSLYPSGQNWVRRIAEQRTKHQHQSAPALMSKSPYSTMGQAMRVAQELELLQYEFKRKKEMVDKELGVTPSVPGWPQETLDRLASWIDYGETLDRREITGNLFVGWPRDFELWVEGVAGFLRGLHDPVTVEFETIDMPYIGNSDTKERYRSVLKRYLEILRAFQDRAKRPSPPSES